MKRLIVTSADLSGTPLSELKSWLAISANTFDAALELQLRAALDLCEAFTGQMPLEQMCEQILPVRQGWQMLATAPVNAIQHVEGIPAEGPRFALPGTSYSVDIDAGGKGHVNVSSPGAAGRIAVGFTAGIAPSWSSLPAGLRQGIIRAAAHLYRDSEGGKPETLPVAIAALWQPWRQMRLA